MHYDPGDASQHGSRHIRDRDQALLASLRAGSDAEAERSFDALIRAYYDELLRYAIRALRSHAAAEDVMQDVFLHLWATRMTLEVRESFRAYLYAALRRKILDYVKVERRHIRREDAIAREHVAEASRGDVWDRDADAVQAIEQADLASAVHGAIGQLPERCREAYVLSREHGLSYPEIAETLGISVNTVKTQMGRAIAVLRRVAAPFLALVLALRP